MIDDEHQFFLRLDLYKELQAISKQHNRSIAAEIRLAIETHTVKFKAEQGE